MGGFVAGGGGAVCGGSCVQGGVGAGGGGEVCGGSCLDGGVLAGGSYAVWGVGFLVDRRGMGALL